MDVNELAHLFIEETTTIQWPVERCIGGLNSVEWLGGQVGVRRIVHQGLGYRNKVA